MTDHDHHSVAIVTPMLNEAAQLQCFHRHMMALRPPPAEILLVDGNSDDGSAAIARAMGFAVICPGVRGRAAQINAGVGAVKSPYICVIHADSAPPTDAIAIIRTILADPKTSLGGFTAILTGPKKTRWLTSFHNWIKTWYVPLIFRPWLFLRGGRLLFGDHGMFFRRSDFLHVKGCDPTLMVMEDADLCLRLATIGRARLVHRAIYTSDRRIARWGPLKANLIFVAITLLWGFGFKHFASRLYPDIRAAPPTPTPRQESQKLPDSKAL